MTLFCSTSPDRPLEPRPNGRQAGDEVCVERPEAGAPPTMTRRVRPMPQPTPPPDRRQAEATAATPQAPLSRASILTRAAPQRTQVGGEQGRARASFQQNFHQFMRLRTSDPEAARAMIPQLRTQARQVTAHQSDSYESLYRSLRDVYRFYRAAHQLNPRENFNRDRDIVRGALVTLRESAREASLHSLSFRISRLIGDSEGRAHDFSAYFEGSMRQINSLIEAERLTEASRLIRQTNATWRLFDSSHREMPQAQRRVYLGQLYLARGRIEAARGDSRQLQRTYYEARGHDLTGDHRRARLRYRQVLALPAPDQATPHVMEIGRVSMERRQTLELEAVGRIETQMGVVLQTRATRLGENFLVPRNREDLRFFTSRVRSLIESGRADTVDDALAILRRHHQAGRSDFQANGVRSGWRVRAWNGMDNVSVHGGVLEFFGPQRPRTRRITIGREGGVIVNVGASYHFPRSSQERVIEMHGTIPYYRDERGRLVRISFDSPICRRSARGDVPATVTRRYELNEQGRYTGRIHPQSFDAFFNADGSRGDDSVFWAITEMETEAGLTRLTDPARRRGYLVDLGRRIGVRDGSFVMGGMLLEEVFAGHFARALREVRRSQRDDESNQDYQNAMIEAAGRRMQQWMASGELRRRDPEAARAWARYNDIHDVAGEWFNVSEENWCQFQDQVMLLAATLPVTLGAGAIAEGFAGAYIATDAVIAARAVSLMGRFGPQVAAMSGRAAPHLVRGAVTATVAAPVEAGTQVAQDRFYTGREITAEGFAHTAITFGVFRGVNSIFAGGGEVYAASATGRSMTAWAEGSLLRQGLLSTGRFGAHQGVMLSTATGLSYTVDQETPFRERVGHEALNLALISAFSTFAPGRGGPRSFAPHERVRLFNVGGRIVADTPGIFNRTSSDRLAFAETIAHLRLGNENVSQSRYDRTVRNILREWQGRDDWIQLYERERTSRIAANSDRLLRQLRARPNQGGSQAVLLSGNLEATGAATPSALRRRAGGDPEGTRAATPSALRRRGGDPEGTAAATPRRVAERRGPQEQPAAADTNTNWMASNLQPGQMVFINGDIQVVREVRDGRLYYETGSHVRSVELNSRVLAENFGEIALSDLRPTENGLSQVRLDAAAGHLDIPISVYRHVDPQSGRTTYYVLDGHHRLAAAQLAGRSRVRVRFDFHTLDMVQDRIANDSNRAFPVPERVAELRVDPRRSDDRRGPGYSTSTHRTRLIDAVIREVRHQMPAYYRGEAGRERINRLRTALQSTYQDRVLREHPEYSDAQWIDSGLAEAGSLRSRGL